MEKGTATEENNPSDENNVHEDSGDNESINIENLNTNSSTDNCSDSSLNTHSNTSELSSRSTNINKMSSDDSGKESKTLFKSSLACSDDCNGIGLAMKSCPECKNCSNFACICKLEHNVNSDNDHSLLKENNLSQGYLNDQESRQSKSNSFSQHLNYIFPSNFSKNEAGNSTACDDFRNEREACDMERNKHIPLFEEEKKDELVHDNLDESPNLKALATVLDEVEREIYKKNSASAEQINDETDTSHSDADAPAVVSGSKMSGNSVNSDSHGGKSNTTPCDPQEIPFNLSKYFCSNNILSSSSDFSQLLESNSLQQTSVQTTFLHGMSPGFTNAKTTLQSNNDKTKVSFSFPLSAELNFNFKINDAFSNMPASKNSVQIKEHDSDTSRNIPCVTNSTSSKTSIGLFERQTDCIFKPLENSQSTPILMSKTSDNSNIFKSLSSKMPLFRKSIDFTSESPSNVQSPKLLNSHSSENITTLNNNGNESSTPRFDFSISSKTPSSGAKNSDSRKTSTFSFVPFTSSSGFSKTMFPVTVPNTLIQSSSKPANEVKLDQASVSFRSPTFSTSNSIFPAISQYSMDIFKSSIGTSTSASKLPLIKPSKLDGIGRTSGSALSGSSSSDNIQTVTTYSELFSSSPFFNTCSAAPLFATTTAKSLFGDPVLPSRVESSPESVSKLLHSDPLTNNKLSQSEASANKKQASTFGCTPKENVTKQFLFDCNTPLKYNASNTAGSIFNSDLFKTTPSTTGYNFGTSSTAVNFNFGSSLITPNNSPFIFKCTGKETVLKPKLCTRRCGKIIPLCKPYYNNIPEIPKIPFRAATGEETCLKNGVTQRIKLRYQCITILHEYSSFSFEELRFQYDKYNIELLLPTDYNNIPEISKISFRAVTEEETYLEDRVMKKFTVRYQCITAMPEYSSFSFEELRFQYDKYNIKLNHTGISFTTDTTTTTKSMISKRTQTSETNLDGESHLLEIWKVLECPVCLEIVTPPVHQCEQGHHVCNNCWRKIASCPLCKRYRMQTRNYVAEAMVEKLPLPCKYRVDGCMKTMQQKEKTLHEEKCIYRTYSCLAQDCNKVHNFKDMVTHLKTVHGHLMTSNERSWHPDSWTLTKHNFQKLVHAFEIPYWGLFFLRHKKSGQNNFIWMQMINIGTSENEFLYSVEVADIKELRSVSYKGPVFQLHATINDNEDCLIIPEDLLSALKSDHVLRIKVSVLKKYP